MKKEYKPPKITNVPEEIHHGVPAAVYAAVLLIARAIAKVMKGGIDLTAGIDSPQTLQAKHQSEEGHVS